MDIQFKAKFWVNRQSTALPSNGHLIDGIHPLEEQCYPCYIRFDFLKIVPVPNYFGRSNFYPTHFEGNLNFNWLQNLLNLADCPIRSPKSSTILKDV
jgi:hypothetical protein